MPYFPLGKSIRLEENDRIVHLGGNITCKDGKPTMYSKHFNSKIDSGTEVIYRDGKPIGAIKSGVPQWMVGIFYPNMANVVEIRDLTDDEKAEAEKECESGKWRSASEPLKTKYIK